MKIISQNTVVPYVTLSDEPACLQTQQRPQIKLRDFLAAFFPDPNEAVHLRAFAPKLAPERSVKMWRTTRGSLPFDTSLRKEIRKANETHGVYFVVNSGGNSDAEIARYNAFFVENDTLPLAEQHTALDAAPILPSIRNETKKSVHAYWLIEGECPKEEWEDIQLRLIAFFDGDRSIKNPSRCMRAPGLNHVSYSPEEGYTHKPVTVVAFDPTRRYTVAHMRAAFPAPPQTGQEQAERDASILPASTNKQFSTWDELNHELRQRVMSAGKPNSRGKFEMRCPSHNGDSDTSLFCDPKTEAVKCMAGCTHAEVLRAFGLPEHPAQDEETTIVEPPSQRESQATQLVELVKDAELFAEPENDTYATLPVGDHKETWSLKSSGFRQLLSRRYYEAQQQAPSAQAIKDALCVLEGKALFEGKSRSVYTRIAEHEGAIYLDLADELWRAVKVTADGWEVVSNPPVKFQRKRGMMPLPLPVRGGSVDELDRFINVHGDERILVKMWLVAALRPRGPYPVLVFNGEQGSAKSTTARVLCDLVDPNEAALRSEPRDERDMVIAATNRMVVAFDNLSRISPALSDALCRIATGGGYATRQLYTDSDEKIFNVQRPILLTGIEELATRGDLIDRSIIVSLPPIEDTGRRPEEEFWREFGAARPRILGALLDAVSAALRKVASVRLEKSPRMADFALWGTAAEEALGMEAGAFMRAYNENRDEANDMALDASPFATSVRLFMAGRVEWVGTAAELLKELNKRMPESITRRNTWPQFPRGVTNALKRSAPNLRHAGLFLMPMPREGGTGRRLLRLQHGKSAQSQSSQPSQEATEAAFGMTVGDGIGLGLRVPSPAILSENGCCDCSDGSDGTGQTLFELQERAAIREFEGNLPRDEAEQLSATEHFGLEMDADDSIGLEPAPF